MVNYSFHPTDFTVFLLTIELGALWRENFPNFTKKTFSFDRRKIIATERGKTIRSLVLNYRVVVVVPLVELFVVEFVWFSRVRVELLVELGAPLTEAAAPELTDSFCAVLVRTISSDCFSETRINRTKYSYFSFLSKKFLQVFVLSFPLITKEFFLEICWKC